MKYKYLHLTLGMLLILCMILPLFSNVIPISMKVITTKPKVSQTTTITFWYTENDNEKPVLLEKVAAFEAANPDIIVQAEQHGLFGIGDAYRTAFDTGNEPYVLRAPSQEVLVLANLSMISPLTEEFTQADKDDFVNATLNWMTYEGEIWGFPQQTNCQMFYINKHLFDAVGIDSSKLNWTISWTWPEFWGNLTTLNQTAGVYALSLAGMSFGAHPYYYGQGANFVESGIYDHDHIAINNSKSRAALTFLKNLTDSTVTPPWTDQGWANYGYDFSNGEVAMIATGPWDVLNLLANSPQFNGTKYGNDNLGFIQLPHDVDNNYGSTEGGNYYVVSSHTNSSEYNASVKLAKFLSSQWAMVKSAIENFHIPARKSVMNNASVIAAPSYPYIKPFFEQSLNAYKPVPSPYYLQLENAFGNYIDQYLSGSMDLDQVIDLITLEWLHILPGEIVKPTIIINSPKMNEIFGIIAPNYNISINVPNIDSMWYTLDNGLTNIHFSAYSGIINQEEWDKKGRGSVTLTFYANDTFGDLGTQSVSLKKDYDYWTLDPIIIDNSGGGNYTWGEASNKGWCSGSGNKDDPYIIDYLKIKGYNSYSCIEIRNSNLFFTIRNSMFYDCGDEIYDAGIKFHHVSNGVITNNSCSSNNGNGIVLETSQNNIIKENTVNNNGLNGIFLLNSSNNSILNNIDTIFNNSKNGINLLWSDNNTIIGNVINYNSIGVYLSESNYNIITGNDLRYNNKAYEQVNCEGNVFKNNILDANGLDVAIIIAVISIVIGISIAATVGLIIRKRKTIITEEVKEDKIQKKKFKMKHKLQKRIIKIDEIIKENMFNDAINDLLEIKEKAQFYEIHEFVKKIEEKIKHCRALELKSINKIKQTVKELGRKYPRLQLMDISEKCGVKDEILIEKVIRDMVKTKEIQGDYFSTSKALVVEFIAPKLVSDLKKETNVFLSYSTLDTAYFEISRIVSQLESYPEISNVYFWEADSGEDIVTYMEQTLKRTNIFVLFCSENSIKSKAVEDEWHAAYQLRKKELMKIIPVYEKEEHIPYLLMPLLNVKFIKDDFDGFIQKLYEEILR